MQSSWNIQIECNHKSKPEEHFFYGHITPPYRSKLYEIINSTTFASVIQCIVLIIGVIGYGFYDNYKTTELLKYERRTKAAEKIATDFTSSLANLMELKRNSIFSQDIPRKSDNYPEIISNHKKFRELYNQSTCESIIFSVKSSVWDCLDYKLAGKSESIEILIERIRNKVKILESLGQEKTQDGLYLHTDINGNKKLLELRGLLPEIPRIIDSINDDIETLSISIQDAAIKKWRL